jgi:hypothetical protein
VSCGLICATIGATFFVTPASHCSYVIFVFAFDAAIPPMAAPPIAAIVSCVFATIALAAGDLIPSSLGVTLAATAVNMCPPRTDATGFLAALAMDLNSPKGSSLLGELGAQHGELCRATESR